MNELPVPIIHHILSFDEEADTKQVTRLNLVSKWWKHACSSYQVLDFSETSSSVDKIQRFIRFVDNTMNRYRDSNNTSIQKLKLRIDFEIFLDQSNISEELPLRLDNWINIALDKHVHHLELRIRVRSREDRYNCNWRYRIPTRVLSSDTVKSLSLGWQVCLPRSWYDDPHDLSIHTLELHQVQQLDDDETAFRRLIRASPAIQTLTIDTQLEEIELSDMDHLKTVTIRRRYVIRFEIINTFKLKIESSSLENLSLTDLGHGRDRFRYYTASMDLDCSNLKLLKLTRDCCLDDDRFHQLLSQLPLLEVLQLQDCGLINNINIACNPLLKKIELKFGNLWKILSVHISSPKVVHFRCETTSGIRLPSIYWTRNYPRYVEAVFKDTAHPLHLYCYWFRKLRESMLGLRSNNNNISMSFNYIWEKKSLEEKELVPTSLPACKIDDLNLFITARSPSYPVILNRLFSTFHPETLQVPLVENDNGEGRNFLQFVCENLANRGMISSCSDCFGDFKCWKHQLENVKIQGTKGPHEDEDGNINNWSTMMKQLSTITIDHHICFKLKWAT